jgi:hypothetical protein
VVLRFLEDYRDQRLRDAVGALFDGAETVSSLDPEWRGRARLADEMTVLERDHLMLFYGFEDPPKEEESRP